MASTPSHSAAHPDVPQQSTATDPGPPADLTLGSFTDDAPWVMPADRSLMPWTLGIRTLRTSTARLAPALTKRRWAPPSARLILVAARLAPALAPWMLVDRRRARHDEARRSAAHGRLSRRLRRAAEHLGPTYIKLGQIISSGEGLFPSELVDEFRKCRDQVPAEPFEVVARTVTEELQRPLEEVFARFDREPLAAASIAQVHTARLVTGEEVVVKVQRPTIRSLVHNDLRVMSWIAPLLVGRIPVAALANPPALVDLFAETICEELDFRLEAENMLDVAQVFADLGQRGYVVPRPHPELVTRRLLVMERLSGFGFEDVAGMTDAGIDTVAVVRTGMKGFIEGCVVRGIFHGDLHGGNLLVLNDGRIGLLDYGITARMTTLERHAFLRLMITGAIGDLPGQVAAFRDLGALPPDTDIDDVVRELGLDKPVVDPTTMDQEQLVREIQQAVKALLGMGARLPKILMLYVKNLVFLDGAIARLAPDLDLIAEITELSTWLAVTHGEAIASEIGIDPREHAIDEGAIKASFGLTGDTGGLTYAELRDRRDLIRNRLRR